MKFNHPNVIEVKLKDFTATRENLNYWRGATSFFFLELIITTCDKQLSLSLSLYLGVLWTS